MQVPTCPEWTLFDLAQHWARCAAVGPQPLPGEVALDSVEKFLSTCCTSAAPRGRLEQAARSGRCDSDRLGKPLAYCPP
ncbi:hypothetical protein [Micromonospora sp. NPDC053811]|uniref:hypothetical protein n=1 Tax=Micromonospora sp. NPDC053811 TaxID=3154956 RepID=UPI003420CCE3